MKTLVYHSGALGDFLSIFPLLKIWRENTKSPITLLGRPEYGALAQMSGLTDNILDIDSKENMAFFSETEQEKTKTLFNRYSHCILFAKNSSPLVTNAEKYCKGRVLSQNPFPSSEIHIIDYHCQLIKEYVTLHNSAPDVPFLKVLKKIDEFTPGAIVIHPGSGSKRKNWAFSSFLYVAEKIRSRGFQIIWITGPAEERFTFPVCDTVYNNRQLCDLVNLFSQSALYIGNDSGVTHLAAASGCSVIAIFGPSDPAVWSPKGEKQVIVVYKKTSCSPCHLRCSSQAANCNTECLVQITPEEVAKLIDVQLDQIF